MGVIADTLRSTLRDLAEADARLYRGLAEELATPATRPALSNGDIAAAIALLEALRAAYSDEEWEAMEEAHPTIAALVSACCDIEAAVDKRA